MSDSNHPQNTPKLPKEIAQMVEKNNLVLAIKTLVAQENLTFDEAKNRIDAFEAHLKSSQQEKQASIVQAQAKKSRPPKPFKRLLAVFVVMGMVFFLLWHRLG